eukprot:CAMPEP_0206221126 /NCGR_PEP_ID=MMETSP0047_2-20121206/5243_1 /ASSEMBLY_ACC=CAM_ASM_000192 /TAXON_ID=195065 /ORGANISM="Chroomonas mesostigmatica_cf, Strain CCMP1168" /LENGTH=167 /DNA_ID=CAMNT_0053643829 /DNA_START=44 /DNA_END=548 /DNA_ORIENTATION=-
MDAPSARPCAPASPQAGAAAQPHSLGILEVRVFCALHDVAVHLRGPPPPRTLGGAGISRLGPLRDRLAREDVVERTRLIHIVHPQRVNAPRNLQPHVQEPVQSLGRHGILAGPIGCDLAVLLAAVTARVCNEGIDASIHVGLREEQLDGEQQLLDRDRRAPRVRQQV